MSVKVKCPNCDKFVLVESEEVGTKVKCVLCSKLFTARPDWMADGQPIEKQPPKKEKEKDDLLAQEKEEKKAKEKGKGKKAKQKAKEDEFLEPDVRWKPTTKDTPDKFVTCPECGKELPATAHICNRCGWNLVLGRQAMAKGRSPAATVARFAVFACVLVIAGIAIGIGVRYFRAHSPFASDREIQEPAAKPPSSDHALKPKPSPRSANQKPNTSPSAGKPTPDKPAAKPVRKRRKPSVRPTPKPPARQDAPGPPDPMDSLAESVVIVKTRKDSGLGFIVDPTTALVATNRHLLEAGREITIVAFPHGSKQWREFTRATVLSVHKKADVALLSFNPRGAKLEAALLAGEVALKKGDKVLTITRPSTSEVKEIEGAVTHPDENVSGMSAIVTSATVEAGTTGAPLFDSAGSVVGINTYSEVWKPKAFAVDIRYVRELLDNPEDVSLSAEETDTLLKKGLDPLRDKGGKGLLGRTLLKSPATKILVGPSGAEVYALVPGENAIQVLSRNQVAASIFVGTNPTDFDITPDGKQLYVSVSQPTGISIVNLKKRAKDKLVRLEAERAFGVRALAGDRALVTCGVIYRPIMPLAADKDPLTGVQVMVVNLRTGKVEQEIKNEAPLPVLKSITDQMPKKWTKKNMETRREWQAREIFAQRLFAFPVIARSHDGKDFYVAGYDQKTSTLKAKDLFALFRYSTRRTVRPEATGPDRIALYVPPEIKEATLNRKKTTRRAPPGPPPFAQFPQTMLVGSDGKIALLGAAVLNGDSLQLTGTLKRNDAVYAKDPMLCNIHAGPGNLKIAFSGANVFDMKTFTDIAPLPITGTVMAVDAKGAGLHVYNPSDNKVYSFDVHSLLPH